MGLPMRKPQLCAVVLSSALCLSGLAPCHAGDGNISEQAFLQDMPTVLSASRLRQPLSETPNAVTVIDRAMIKASGFRTIADLFKMVPGMYVDYMDGYTPFVTYHGATDSYTRRMQVLVDGRSVYLPPYNTVDWEDLPLHIDDIERIEVVHGPAATSYGTNSILGVINISTRDAAAQHGVTLSATRGNAGNAGVSDAVVHFGSTGEVLDYRVTFGKRSDNGFDFPAGTPTYFNVTDDSSTTTLGGLRGNYHPNAVDSFDFQAGFSSGVRMTGYSGFPPRPLSPLHQIKTDSGHQQLTWLRALERGDDIQLRYYHISRKVLDEKVSLVAGWLYPQPYHLSDSASVQRHEVELQHTLHTSTDNRLVWGAATRYESADAPFLLLNSSQAVHESRLFVHDELRIMPSLVLNGGAMLENDGMGHKNTSPRVALNFHISPEHTLRAGVSVAYRNPALMEEKSNQRYYLPNPLLTGFNPDYAVGLTQYFLSYGGLRPERALSREVGYIGQFGNGLSVDLRAYSDQVSDIIWLDYILVPGSVKAPSWGFRNEFAAQYTGLEGAIKYSWGEQRNSLTLNYSHQNVSCSPVGSPYLAANPFVGALATSWYAGIIQAFNQTVPTNAGSLIYVGQIGDGFSLGAGYYQQGRVQVLDAPGQQPLTRRTDMRVAKKFGSMQAESGVRGEIAVVVQNVFQDNNKGYSGYLFSRRAYLTATFNF